MKKAFFLWLFIAITFSAFSQGKTLYSIASVKPKAGMKMAFEAAWKTHLDKYHVKEEDRQAVYEITTGVHAGTYMIVTGPMSYADMDIEKANRKEHGADLQSTISGLLESNVQSWYRWDDTASYHGDVVASKFNVQVTHIKWGMQIATIREAKRGSLLNRKLNPNDRFSFNVYVQQFSGSDPVIVNVRNLKDGFKEMENGYYGPNPMANQPDAFKNAYIAQYGQADWDARQKLVMDNANVASREVYLMVLRKDLSTPVK